MKNFSSKRKGNFRRTWDSGVVRVILYILLALLALTFLRFAIAPLSAVVMTPIYGMRAWIAESGGAIPSYVRDRGALIAENRELQERISVQAGDEQLLEHVVAENAELRSQLGVLPAGERIVAGVIARPPFIPYDAVMIDQGSGSGIQEGAVVYRAPNQAIGTITKTYQRSSLVTLFSTPGIETTVYVIGPDIYTTAYGEGGGVVRVSVPQGILISAGDIVVTPSLDSGTLGTISSVRSADSEPEQHGYLTSVALQSLHTVTVSTQVPEAVSFEEAQANVATAIATFVVDVPSDLLIDVGTTTASSTQSTTTPEEVSGESETDTTDSVTED